MSAWGDTLTEQLAHDILMDQQQASYRGGGAAGLGPVPSPGSTAFVDGWVVW